MTLFRPLVILCLIAALNGCGSPPKRGHRQSRALSEFLAKVPSDQRQSEELQQRITALRRDALRAKHIYRVGDAESGSGVIADAISLGPAGFGYLFIELPTQFVKFASGGETPGRAVRLMQSPQSADNRWRGINAIARWDFARREPYTMRYRQIGRGDDDRLVRAVAFRASNRSRDDKARPDLIKALTDESDWVRLEAAKGLVNLPDPAAVDTLLGVVANTDEQKDVRIAAVEALQYYRRLEVARALVARLSDADFALSWQARRSLRELTKRDYRYNESAWLSYFTGPEKPFG